MQIQINTDKRELKPHGQLSFPVLVTQEILSRYERGAFSWHWHPEVELTLIMEGSISYQINSQIFQLHAGDGIFCNSNALHTGHMINQEDCYYISITFHPRMIYGFEGSALQTEFVNPILDSNSFSAFLFSPDIPWQHQVLEQMRDIFTLSLEHPSAFEMRTQQLLSSIWTSLYLYGNTSDSPLSLLQGKNVERLRCILLYIQEHYMEHITLEDIADQINICKSECCRFFKKHMQQSLFDYLLYYRVEKSLALLADHTMSIAEISELTGFCNPAYFSRVFKKQLQTSPTQYRSEHLENSRHQ
ncbi:MAG: AraC family transcriptional regulator [Lachnospiraceae bacterium]|nr:AraC family transcriptional regulator [Lachnospiraceae bacterium]